MLGNSLAKTKHRENWLDIAKFFGITMVVLNHMDLNIPVITFFGGMFYMPLFFVAAGYTYKNKGEDFKTFALGKAKRLLIPYILCNVFLVAFFTVLNFLKASVHSEMVSGASMPISFNQSFLKIGPLP